MGRPNQIDNSGGPDQANSAYLNSIKTKAIGRGESSAPRGAGRFGKRRIYQLGAEVPDANKSEEASGQSEG